MVLLGYKFIINSPEPLYGLGAYVCLEFSVLTVYSGIAGSHLLLS